LTFKFTPSKALAASDTITLTADKAIFKTASTKVTCTATVKDATTAPTFVAADTKCGANKKILTLKLGATAATDIVAASKEATVVCTTNLAVNGAAGEVVAFSIVTAKDPAVLAAQTGYTVTDTQVQWGGASRKSLITGEGGDLTFKFTPSKALAASDTITLTADKAIFKTASTKVTCTATVKDATTAPTFVAADTKCGANKKILTLKLGATAATDIVAASKEATVVCTTNLAVNGAAGEVVAFSIVTAKDPAVLAAQTGYTVTAAPAVAAASTTSVNMITIVVALAAVALRQ